MFLAAKQQRLLRQRGACGGSGPTELSDCRVARVHSGLQPENCGANQECGECRSTTQRYGAIHA